MKFEKQLRLADNLAALRKAAELSQSALSQKLIVVRSTYAQYEQGDRLPDIDLLYMIANFYRVNIDTLIDHDKEKVLEEFYSNQESSDEERQLAELYSRLSDFGKGSLIELAEEIARKQNSSNI